MNQRLAKDDVPLAASSITGRLALWSIRHRRRVLFAWLLLLIAGLGACFSVPASTDIKAEGTGESKEAIVLFQERFNVEEAALTEFLVISHDTLSVNNSAYREVVIGLVAELRALRTRETFDVLGTTVEGSVRFVAETTTHYDTGSSRADSPFVAQTATGGDITFVLIELEPELDDAIDGVEIFTEVIDRAAANHPDFQIAVGGGATIAEQLNSILEDDFAIASFVSLALTAVILMLALGAMAAVVFPLVVGFAVVAIAVGTMNLISQAGMELNDSFSQVILLVGLAAAIDYGIYMISRYRHERRAGYPELAAVLGTMGTVGKAILIAAMTTVLALSGLFFMGEPDFTSLGLAAIVSIVVAFSMSVTLMPAWLALAGDGIERWRIPFVRGGFASVEGGGIVSGGIDRMMSRPLIYAPLAVAAMLVIAAPLLAINVGNNGIRAFTDDAAAKAPLLELERSFSLGLVVPAVVVVDAGESGSVFSAAVQADLQRLDALIAAETASATNPEGVFDVPILRQTNDAANTQFIEIPVNADTGDPVFIETIKRLRSEIVPAAFVSGASEALVTGNAAGGVDFVDKMNSRLPITIAFVVVTSFLVLVVMFRSIVLPLVAILLNLLAVGAAFGVMKLAFQDGYALEGLLNYQATGIIEAWVPIFVFAIMFGISFDDLTFAIGRVREGHERGEDVDTAVRTGLKSVAMTILAADLILVSVVGIFAFMRFISMQQLGVAMAVAVLLGALLVIVIVMPALMRAIGDRLWYFPRQLEWIPIVTTDDSALRTLYQTGPGVAILAEERALAEPAGDDLDAGTPL